MVNAKELMTEDFVSLDVNDSLAKFIGAMKTQHVHSALLFDQGAYAGIADKKSLVRTKIDPDSVKLKHILKKVPILSSSVEEAEMARLFINADTRTLPVLEQNKVVGVVHAHSLLPFIQTKLAQLRAEDVASKKIIVFKETDSVDTTIATMNSRGIDRAPVVDNNGKLTGIMTLVDLYIDFYLHHQSKKTNIGSGKGTSPGKLALSNFMVEECSSVSPKAKMFEIINLFDSNQINSVVVVDKEKPVGIITTKDLLMAFVKPAY